MAAQSAQSVHGEFSTEHPPKNAIRGSPDKMDAGHWVGTFGGFLMLAVVVLNSVGVGFPWWTGKKETPVHKSTVEVSLWTRYSRMEFSQNAAALDCTNQCDVTMRGAKTVRELKDNWTSVCREAGNTMAETCNKLWAVRVFVLVSWFCAVLYFAGTWFGTLGSGRPASCRAPAGCIITLGICCFVTIVLALCIGSSIKINLSPAQPGTAPPKPGTPAATGDAVGMNGPGFKCVLAATFISLAGLGVAFMHQGVMNGLHKFWEFENGRELADHRHGSGPEKFEQKPPPRTLNAWPAITSPEPGVGP